MRDLLNLGDYNALENALVLNKGDGVSDRHRVSKWFKNVKVIVKYGSNGHEAYQEHTIEGLIQTNASQFTFEREGKRISIKDYCLQHHNFRLERPNLPLIQTKKAKVVLPIEICHIVDNQRFAMKLNSTQTSEMIKFAVTPPKVRWGHIEEKIRLLNWQGDPCLQHYGMKIKPNPTVANGRVLPNPRVNFAHGNLNPGTRGSWILRGQKFLKSNFPIECYGVCIFSTLKGQNPRYQLDSLKPKFKDFTKTLIDHGIAIRQAEPFFFYWDANKRAENIQEFWQATGNAQKKMPSILFFIVHDRSVLNYQRIKRYCDTKLGVVSQVMSGDALSKGNPQYYSNVAMKVNAKLGGVTNNTISAIQKDGRWFGAPTLIIGGDVSHGSPSSIAAMTFSWDSSFVKYLADVRANGERVEMISEENIKAMVGTYVKNWKNTIGNGSTPKHIIYMRDGVSERQYIQVKEQEVKHIIAAVRAIDPAWVPKMTVIVGTKRHQVRFFIEQQAGLDNPVPGTLVETGVTHPFDMDYYLCSHKAIKGTARPMHYYVIQDDANLGLTHLQNMIYEQCYQYVRSTTPVSMHPAIYYADLAAGRAAAHYDQPLETEPGLLPSKKSGSEEVVKLIPLAGKPEIREKM